MSTSITYSDAELDAQYDNRAAVPEHVGIMAEWERLSEQIRSSQPCRLDLAYGDGPRETLDLFTVSTPDAPVHVYIHGGYWQRGDKRIYSCVAEALLRRGINVALVGYDLCPAVGMDDIVAQVRSALAWIWRSAPELGVDPRRIQLSGHSAGGHLTAMVLATPWKELGDDLPGELVHSAIAISGLFDLAPLVVAVGELEGAEYHRQAESLVAAWKPQGVPAELLDVPGTNHFTIVETLAREGVLLDRAMALLEAPG
jgi:arylformamidase